MLMEELAVAKLCFHMQQISPVVLSPAIQRYDWGSPTDIPRLFGIPNPNGEAMAELWYGTHPDGLTQVCDITGAPVEYDLRSFVQQDPERSLGPDVVERFGSELPFLLKVIAAGQPLSLQAHPSKDQAEAGFAREECLGIPQGAPHRSYRDRNHKPELVAALTPFGAMVGFRDPGALEHVIAPIEAEAGLLLAALASGGVERLFDDVLALSLPQLQSIINAVQRVAPDESGERGIGGQEQDSARALCYQTILRLALAYPNDPGVLAPLYLNVLHLDPGAALCLPAGVLHAYLYGVGVEIMANSNNVLRGGLTSKYVDREELRRVVSFEPYLPPVLSGAASFAFPTSFEEFALSRLELTASPFTVARSNAGPEILLCTKGTARVKVMADANGSANQPCVQDLEVPAGKAVFVPAFCTDFVLTGPATVFRACVGTAPA
ncbi:MAG: mannose-6-phosphate isomerase, class I [Spirochaetaceae bacterium]|nr:MAG: mannose-6-phosphate isomerase, class I [Spirochaetaceae bacterium]